jgi:hypothetical protein
MQRFQRAALAGILIGSVAGLSQTAAAQSQPTPPRPVSQPAPPQPSNRIGLPVQGWAIVRYSVNADGATENVRVTAAVPPSIDTTATIEAVESWTFSPAMRDGEAVAWHNNESAIAYGTAEPDAEVSEDFQERYEEVRLILEGAQPIDYGAARNSNTFLLEETAIQRGELGLALAQSAIISIGLEQPQDAYEKLTLATDPRINALTGQSLFAALQLRGQIAGLLGRSLDALETYERIESRLGPEQDNPFAALIADLRQLRQDREVLEVLGSVDDHLWHIGTDRRIFTIANIDGAVDKIEVECDGRRASLEFQPDVEWQLPDSWGDCELFVDADPGTMFNFYEFLAPAEAAE